MHVRCIRKYTETYFEIVGASCATSSKISQKAIFWMNKIYIYIHGAHTLYTSI